MKNKGTLFGVLIALMLMSINAPAADSVGFVAQSKGDANVIRSGESLQATMGMEIHEGDKLITGNKARLKVLFSDDALVALGANTEVVVTRHLFKPAENSRTTRIELLGGKLRALVQRVVAGNKADFEVKTSNAVAGVRGTEFVLVADADRNGPRLYTFSGSVALQGPDGEPILVAAGQGSRIQENGEAAPAEMVAKAELDEVRLATDSEQSPSALAWSVPPRPSDHLQATRYGIESEDVSDADLDLPADRTGLGNSNSPPIREGTIPDGADIGDEGAAGFGGMGAAGAGELFFDGDLTGLWANPDSEPIGNMMQTTVRINLHRK
jgi:hypothetical protein